MPLESYDTNLEAEDHPPERPSLEFLLRRQHVTSLTRELDLSYAYDVTPEALDALFSAVPQLAKLVIRDTALKALPKSLCQLTSLRELDVSDNQLSELPNQFGPMHHLQHLNLSRNQLAQLPPSIVLLGRLRLLNVNYNALVELPAKMGQLPQLRVLRVGANKLSSLPETLAQLKELRLLQLAYNAFDKVPKLCMELKRLRVLDVAHNQISELPDSLRQKTSLMSLNVTGNPIEQQRHISFASSMRVLGLAHNETARPVEDLGLAIHTMQPPGAAPARSVRPDLTGIFLAGLDGPQTATGTFILDSLDDEHTQPDTARQHHELEGWDAGPLEDPERRKKPERRVK